MKQEKYIHYNSVNMRIKKVYEYTRNIFLILLPLLPTPLLFNITPSTPYSISSTPCSGSTILPVSYNTINITISYFQGKNCLLLHKNFSYLSFIQIFIIIYFCCIHYHSNAFRKCMYLCIFQFYVAFLWKSIQITVIGIKN